MSVASKSPRSRMPLANADLDLAALGATLWRKKWLILRPTILVALIALIAVQIITPRYMSQSRVFIESRDNIYLRPDADKSVTDPAIDQEAVTSQAQIILSRDLAREVIAKLKLGERPEFDPALNGVSPIRAVLGLLGLAKDPLSMTPEERVLQTYYDDLSVYPVEKSRIIDIDFLSQDPELAAKVANAIADGYLARQREAKQEQARSASEWLSGEIETMRKKVEEAEAKVEDFRSKTNLLIGTNNTTLSAQQLGDLNAQLAAARAQKADAEAKAKMIRDMLKSGQEIESSDILNSELIRRLSEQRVTLRAQLAEQSSTLLDGHPRIKELKAQIADLDTQLRAEATKIARSLENDAKLAGSRVDTLTASLDQLKKQAATTNSEDVQLRALEREAKSQRDLLESYLAKYREATSRDTPNSSPANARVISRATVSNLPAYPKKLPTILIASFATMVLCSGILLTGEILAAPGGAVPVRTERPVSAAEGEPEPVRAREFEPAPGGLASRVAAIVRGPRYRESQNTPAPPIEAAAETAHDLRDTLAVSPKIAVLGVPGMNTSQTAIKLARTLAEEFRVVLVGLASADTEIRGISSEPSASGLAELANGTASFGEIITKDKLSPLQLITPGRAPRDRADILSTPGMMTSFDALARSYEYVVIDAGESAGPVIERISAIAPNAVLVVDPQASAAAASARQRLLAAGFSDVMLLPGARASGVETAAAA